MYKLHDYVEYDKLQRFHPTLSYFLINIVTVTLFSLFTNKINRAVHESKSMEIVPFC